MSRWQRALARLDRAEPMVAAALGGAVGLGGTLALLGVEPGWRLAGGLLLLGGVPALALTAGWVGVPRAEPPPTDVLDMVRLEGGTFWMGSADDDPEGYPDEKPRWQATVPGPLWVQRCPVTNAEYRWVVAGHAKGEPDDLPVTDVSWNAAVDFCNAMSAAAGLKRAYAVEGDTVRWDRSAGGYRLPTEAEWEFACRAGTATQYSFGDDPAGLDEHAWFRGNAEMSKQPVGRKKPNPWGLADMHGNVWEWCWSEFGTYPTRDVDMLTRSAGDRVLRGGSFDGVPRSLRSAFRIRYGPEFRFWDVGFRCVRGARPLGLEP